MSMIKDRIYRNRIKNLELYIRELEVGIIKWAGRPTKDGAKNLRSLVRNYDEALDEAKKK